MYKNAYKSHITIISKYNHEIIWNLINIYTGIHACHLDRKTKSNSFMCSSWELYRFCDLRFVGLHKEWHFLSVQKVNKWCFLWSSVHTISWLLWPLLTFSSRVTLESGRCDTTPFGSNMILDLHEETCSDAAVLTLHHFAKEKKLCADNRVDVLSTLFIKYISNLGSI